MEPLLHKSRDGKKPPVIHVIANELESIGYRSWAYRVISTAGFGIPQKRRRVIMVASMYSDARDVLLAQGRDECHECSYATQGDAEAMQCFECFQRGVGERFSQLKTPPERYAAKYAATSALSMDTNSALGVPSMDMVPTFTTQNFKMCISIPGKPLTMLRIEDAERLQGFPEGFTAVADGSLTDPKRHKLIGNAVSVPIARWVGLGIARPDLHKYFKTDQDMPLAPRYQREPSAWDFDEMDYITQLCGGLGWTSGDYSVAHWNDPSGDADSPEEGDADAQAARKHAIKEQSWPASGYWHIGGLRYGLADMSSVPVKLPFVPLGSFITKLGRLVTKADMDIYTNKLAGRGNKQTAYLIQHIRERGLNVTGDATGFVQFILRLLFSSW